MIKSLNRLWVVALFIAWCFDLLFWEKQPGISFAIFVSLVVLGGVGVSLVEKRPPARSSLLLLIPLAFFALMSFWRLEPFTTLVNILLSLVLLSILAITYRSGGWLRYGWADYARRLVMLVGSAFAKPVQAWSQRHKPEEGSEGGGEKLSSKDTEHKARTRKAIPVLRGLLLAVPVLLLFGALLASADPIFGQGLEDIFKFLSIENLPENLFRLSYILVIGYVLVGVYLHALNNSQDEKLVGVEKPVMPRFLGFTEAVIILSSVNLLFAAFVAVQFRYFFGGQVNIHLDGYTYAEYARRGFSELVLVAFFTLLLFFALSAVAQRSTRGQRIAFSALGAALTVLVGVILISAYQRLLLYEAVYGFSRLRTYTHVFMLWLGVLLVALMLLELTNKLRSFALVSLLVALGFGVTLNLLPVDGLIARQNVMQAQAGSELDSAYLVSLSPDAVSSLWDMYSGTEVKAEVQAQIGGILACQAAINPPEELPWQSFNLARAQAQRLFQAEKAELVQYDARKDSSDLWVVTVNGQTLSCEGDFWTD